MQILPGNSVIARKTATRFDVAISMLAILTPLFFMFECSKTESTYTVETIDGVRYVHNTAPLWGDEPKIELEFVQKIGELDTDDENIMFFKPSDIAKDRSGNFYILDSGNFRVQKFDSDWQFVSSIGKEGQGPGEFLSPTDFAIDKDSNIIINDYFNSRFQIFSSDGKYKDNIKPEKRVLMFDVLSSGEFLTWDLFNFGNLSEPVEKFADTRIFGLFDSNGKYKKGFGAAKDFGDNSTNFDGNLVRFIVTEDDYIVTSYVRQNKIEKYTPDGTLLLSVDRPLNFDLDPEMRSYIDPNSGETRSYKALPSVAGDIGVDHKERMWVSTYARQPDTNIDPANPLERKKSSLDQVVFEIFRNDGVLLCTLPRPEYYRRVRIIKDHVYLIDDAYEMCIYEYKIIEK